MCEGTNPGPLNIYVGDRNRKRNESGATERCPWGIFFWLDGYWLALRKIKKKKIFFFLPNKPV